MDDECGFCFLNDYSAKSMEKNVTGCVARSECLVTRNMRWCERYEFICRSCHWPELYHQVFGNVPTEVHCQSTIRSFLIAFFNYKIKHLHAEKSDVSLKLHRKCFNTYTLSCSCILHIKACLIWNSRNCTTLHCLIWIIYSYLSWGYTLRLLKRLFCFWTRYEHENSAFRSPE
jgi:hypothetical protein